MFTFKPLTRPSFAGTVVLAMASLLNSSALASTPASVGQPAPAFIATDTSGKRVSLADYKGKHVVLEWVNPGCPYVVKHYGSGNMQGTQKEAAAKGVVWLAVNSTAAEHGDYKAPPAMAQWMQSQKAADIATATNHVKVALAETLAGKPIALATTRPYGCSVKYPSM